MEKGIYTRLQLKRAFKVYPSILLVTVITLGAICVGSMLALKSYLKSENKQKVSIGIVGDVHDTYLGIGLSALENFDVSRFSIDFVEMDEQNAINLLKNREISGYIKVPKGFIEGIYRGENKPAKYVTLNSPDGFGSIIMNEIATAVSGLITESQNGIYSMQRLAYKYDKTDNLDKKTNELNITYINYILDRNSSFEHKILGVSDSLSLGAYYICGITIFFLLIWGISCNKLLGNDNVSLSRILSASGICAKNQIFSELLAYVAITALTMCIAGVLSGVVFSNFDLGITEVSGAGVFEGLSFVVLILPVIIMVCAMHKAFYELVSGTVSRVLILFMLAVGLGYVSGCFYPDYFFPDSVQKIASLLPVGVGFSYMRKLMAESFGIFDFLLVSAYAFLFYLIALWARKRKVAGEKNE